MVVSFCSTSDPAVLKNTIEKRSYIPVKMGRMEHRPVVECNRHNWCSVGVTTAPFFCVYPVYCDEVVAGQFPSPEEPAAWDSNFKGSQINLGI